MTKEFILQLLKKESVPVTDTAGHTFNAIEESDFESIADAIVEKLPIHGVSGSCADLISDIEKLERYNIYGTETEGSVQVETCKDGDNIDADELYNILDNYR